MRKFWFAAAIIAATVALAVGLMPQEIEAQSSCCRVVVTGCNQRANVCIPASCSISVQQRAQRAFQSAHSCSSSSVSSYIGTCSGERCDIDMR